MGVLLEGNGLGLVADVDLEPGRARRDRQPLIAELSDDVEGLTRRLLERQAELVRADRALDFGADVGGRLEEAIGRDESVECLVRPLEVVVADEVVEAPLCVDDVGEHGAAEKLVPQRLPESLDLAERLRVLRPAADVMHAHAREQFLELGLAAPHRVLPTVVGQDLCRLPVRRDAPLERLHHQSRLLVVRERVTDDEPAVVVHEHAHVETLGAAQSEGEDVRLPQLVRRRPLEPPRRMLPLGRRFGRLDEALGVQDPPHLLLAHSEGLEASQYVTNPASPPLFVFTLERHYAVALDRVCRLRRSASTTALRLQPGWPLGPEHLHPLRDRCLRNTERLRDVVLPRSAEPFLHSRQLVRCRQLAPHSGLLRSAHVLSSVRPTFVGG
jgi:hypothetical protein